MRLQVLVLMLIATPAFGATATDATVAPYHEAPDRAGNYIVPSLQKLAVSGVEFATTRCSMDIWTGMSTRKNCVGARPGRSAA